MLDSFAYIADKDYLFQGVYCLSSVIVRVRVSLGVDSLKDDCCSHLQTKSSEESSSDDGIYASGHLTTTLA